MQKNITLSDIIRNINKDAEFINKSDTFMQCLSILAKYNYGFILRRSIHRLPSLVPSDYSSDNYPNSTYNTYHNNVSVDYSDRNSMLFLKSYPPNNSCAIFDSKNNLIRGFPYLVTLQELNDCKILTDFILVDPFKRAIFITIELINRDGEVKMESKTSCYPGNSIYSFKTYGAKFSLEKSDKLKINVLFDNAEVHPIAILSFRLMIVSNRIHKKLLLYDDKNYYVRVINLKDLDTLCFKSDDSIKSISYSIIGDSYGTRLSDIKVIKCRCMDSFYLTDISYIPKVCRDHILQELDAYMVNYKRDKPDKSNESRVSDKVLKTIKFNYPDNFIRPSLINSIPGLSILFSNSPSLNF